MPLVRAKAGWASAQFRIDIASGMQRDCRELYAKNLN
jgi:hypothetical protein